MELEALEENRTLDGVLCLFGRLDEKPGWTKQLAGLMTDPRTAPLQSALSIVRFLSGLTRRSASREAFRISS